jgi:hypothetical protein
MAGLMCARCGQPLRRDDGSCRTCGTPAPHYQTTAPQPGGAPNGHYGATLSSAGAGAPFFRHEPARPPGRLKAYLASVLNGGIADADVSPESVAWQDQGDASMLKFPPSTDVGKVLAGMPRYLDEELLDRNRDLQPHAGTRIRLAFTMGVSAPGAMGRVGEAPIAVARLVNWGPFREAMTNADGARVGVIIDDHLYGQYVRQRFRADNNPADYAKARILYADKGFDATAWVRILGYTGEQVEPLLGG